MHDGFWHSPYKKVDFSDQIVGSNPIVNCVEQCILAAVSKKYSEGEIIMSYIKSAATENKSLL